ncbi:DapH/DapD/GlmU-related protein [Paenarthrobacter sp. NPDC089316]
MTAPREVVIEDDVWIGARAIILPGVRVGRGSVVAAAAVVTKSVPPFSVVAGNPARVVKSRADCP